MKHLNLALGLGSIWILGGLRIARADAPIQSDDGRVQWAAALSSPGAIKGGNAATVELSVTIKEGWHVYALTQPAGGPTALRVTVDDNQVALAAGAPSGTPPQKRHDPSFGLETKFYTHAFTIQVPVQLKQQPGTGRQNIPVSVRFQSCSDRECQPPTTVHLTVPVDVIS
jgi:thiol:disulfide interchange protein DsbD